MIEIKNVTKIYNPKSRNRVVALDGMNAVIEDNSLTAVTGESGSGKTTLLNLLCGIDDFQSGDIITDGISVKSLHAEKLAAYRNKKVGLVLQNSALIDDFNVFDNVEVPLIFAGMKRKDRKQAVIKALESTGISSLSKRKAQNLSGGQRQRVAIARAIVNNPDYILADEPTGALDSKTTEEIFSLFKFLKTSGKTVIIVTHELSLAERCDKQIVIKDGKAETA